MVTVIPRANCPWNDLSAKTTCNMNRIRIIVTLALVLAACQLSAQTVDSIPHHVVGYYGPNGGGQWENILHLRDGNILFVHKEGINMNTTGDVVGHEYYKVSRHGATMLDTLFVYDSDPPFYLFAKNPNDDNHIRVGIVRDSVSGGSFLQILPFDNDMNFDTLNEVFVPVSDTIAYGSWKGALINRQNELILTYETPRGNNDWNQHFACYGLDGTLKHENVVPQSSFPKQAYLGFGIFNESPLEYYLIGRYRPNNYSPNSFVCYLFDSLFQYEDSFSINMSNPFYHIQYNLGWQEQMLPYGDDFIFGSRYERGTQHGVCLVRYDKRTLEQKGVVFFLSMPMVPDSSSGACPIQLCKDSDGFLYFSYDTRNLLGSDQGLVAVAKLDADLNVLWQRFCLEPGYSRHGSLMTVLDDGGVAICGGFRGRPEVFFLIVNDDYDGMEEQGFIVRPYAYWPNPVQDELHLQYSPDVTPQSIEIYDLQGRLIKTQRSGLESLSMKGLASGAYTMRVVLEGGKVFSDKVIKE